jgi:hypothetical protein
VHASMKMTGRNRCWVPPTSETNNAPPDHQGPTGRAAGQSHRGGRPASGSKSSMAGGPNDNAPGPTGRATGPLNGELTVAASDRKRRGDYRARYWDIPSLGTPAFC